MNAKVLQDKQVGQNGKRDHSSSPAKPAGEGGNQPTRLEGNEVMDGIEDELINFHHYDLYETDKELGRRRGRGAPPILKRTPVLRKGETCEGASESDNYCQAKA